MLCRYRGYCETCKEYKYIDSEEIPKVDEYGHELKDVTIITILIEDIIQRASDGSLWKINIDSTGIIVTEKIQ
jgi:hypothetical protein